MDIKNTITSSGLYVREFADLCGVSRVAVHTWMAGGVIHYLRKKRIEKLCEAIGSAVQEKELPIIRTRGGEDAEQVEMLIKRIVLKHLKKLAKNR